MRIPTMLALGAAMLLQGCAGAVAIDATRKNAQPLFARVMAEARPDLPSDLAANCVIRALTIGERLEFGTADTTALNSERRARILEFAARPKAQDCMAALPQTVAA